MCLFPKGITTHPKSGVSRSVIVPCGRCPECLKRYSSEWAFRIMDEASCYDNNCFLTLTYNNDYLPSDGSVSKRDFQLFIKRLRKAVYPLKIRYFGCGEYGSHFLRPHYHIVIFGWMPNDMYLFDKRQHLFRSSFLEKIWTFGFSSVGELSYDSAIYCAKYMQKLSFDKRHSGLCPPFVLMSNKPGIGFSQVYNVDLKSCRMYRSGRSCRIPRYYLKVMERDGVYLQEYKDNIFLQGKAIALCTDLVSKRKSCFGKLFEISKRS